MDERQGRNDRGEEEKIGASALTADAPPRGVVASPSAYPHLEALFLTPPTAAPATSAAAAPLSSLKRPRETGHGADTASQGAEEPASAALASEFSSFLAQIKELSDLKVQLEAAKSAHQVALDRAIAAEQRVAAAAARAATAEAHERHLADIISERSGIRVSTRSSAVTSSEFAFYAQHCKDQQGSSVAFQSFTSRVVTDSGDAKVASRFYEVFQGHLREAGADDERAVRAAFNDGAAAAAAMARDLTRLQLLLVDCHATATIGTRKPDLVGTRAYEEGTVFIDWSGRPVISSDAVVVGELKKGAGGFTASDEGQLLSLLVEVCSEQGRQEGASVLGFLCNEAIVQIYEANVSLVRGRPPCLISWTKSAPLSLAGPGSIALARLMMTAPTDLHYELPVFTVGSRRFAATAHLSEGATAKGYLVQERDASGRPIGPALVAKQFFWNDAYKEERELATLRAIWTSAALMGWTPETFPFVQPAVDALAVGRPSQRAALLLAPYGCFKFAMPPRDTDPFLVRQAGWRFPTADDFCELVDVLARLHALGWVHADPRPENFFRVDGGRFVLADAGLAVPAGTAFNPEGGVSLRFGPLDLLACRAGRAPPGCSPTHTPAGDYEIVARLVFAAMVKVWVPVTADYDRIYALWLDAGSNSALLALLDAARAAGEAVANSPGYAAAAATAATQFQIHYQEVLAPLAGGGGGAAGGGDGGGGQPAFALPLPAVEAFKACIMAEYRGSMRPFGE